MSPLVLKNIPTTYENHSKESREKGTAIANRTRAQREEESVMLMDYQIKGSNLKKV